MASRNEILRTLNDWLAPEDFKDYCPNGLQVEGAEDEDGVPAEAEASEEA